MPPAGCIVQQQSLNSCLRTCIAGARFGPPSAARRHRQACSQCVRMSIPKRILLQCLQEMKHVQDQEPAAQVPSAPQKGSPAQHGRQPRLVTELGQQTVWQSSNTFTADQAQEGVLDFVAAAEQEAEVRQFLMGSLEQTTFQLLRSQRPVREPFPAPCPMQPISASSSIWSQKPRLSLVHDRSCGRK